MKRSDFLKAFSGLIATPLLITNLTSATPTTTDKVARLDLNETTTNTFDFVDYIIQRSGGKINGHQLYKAPMPGFLVNPDGTPYVYVEGDTFRGDMKVVQTRKLHTRLDGDFLHRSGGHTASTFAIHANEFFINVMRENVRERQILADKLIKELEEMINKPTYLYKIMVAPIIHNITYDVSFYGIMIRMAV
jgi:hypothetical protein